LKQLSGQDMIRTRFLYRESTEWKPQFKLFFAANYKPQIHETVGAIWHRVQLIPFLATFKGDKRDDQLAQKLEEELSGILAWAVRGCLEWQRIGLNPPDEIKVATSSYRAEMNNVTDFINECCVQDNDARVLASELYRRYREWAIEAGLRFPLSKKALAQELDRMGFESFRTGGKTHYRGLALASFPLGDIELEGEL
jgi:putative DNA primase/helicase